MSNTINEEDRKRIFMYYTEMASEFDMLTDANIVRRTAEHFTKYERERVSQEVAELRKENERLKHNYSSVSDDNMDLDNRVSQQAETIKHLTEALEAIKDLQWHSTSHEIIRKTFEIAKSALSGTKETE